MYSDQVFCFTPKGDVIQLPRGATPLDIAYAIHTRIGNSCVSAKIDGIRVPLWTRLKNGQSVEIITAEGQRPQASWIDIVTTGRAKAAIRRSLREEDRGRFVKLGQELARAAFDHVGKKATDKALRTAAKMLGLADENDLLARLGSAETDRRAGWSRRFTPNWRRPRPKRWTRKRPVVGLTADQTFRRAQLLPAGPGRADRRHHLSRAGRGGPRHRLPRAGGVRGTDRALGRPALACRAAMRRSTPSALDLTISNDAGVLGRICTLIGEQKANISRPAVHRPQTGFLSPDH